MTVGRVEHRQAAASSGPPQAGRRPTIGLLGGPVINEGLEPGADYAARVYDVNLLVFAAGMLEGPAESEASRAVLLDLVGPENIDGLYINTDYLGHVVGANRMRAFAERFRSLPMVNNELPLAGIPRVTMDFYRGMYDVIEHLIQVHRYQRIAFVRAPENSETGNARYRAYRDALSAHGLPFDELLIAPGTFYRPSGKQAVELFLDRRRLRPGDDIQAIACVNDYTAIDLMAALAERGIRVPEQIAVVGFDDVIESSALMPPLTTAYLPTFEGGAWGVEALVRLLAGDPVPELTSLPVPLRIRQSCGCANRALIETTVEAECTATDGPVTPAWLRLHQHEMLAKMEQAAGASYMRDFVLDARPVLETISEGMFSFDPATWMERFLAALGPVPSSMQRDVGRWADAWQGALSGLRHALCPHLGDHVLRARFENLCHLGRVLVAQVAQQTYAALNVFVAELDSLMHQINYEMATTLEISEVIEVLALNLPRLGIPSCYLSLYEDPASPTRWASLHLAMDAMGRVDVGPRGWRFPAKQLIPERLRDRGGRHTHILEPLHFRKEQFGFVLFEVGPLHMALYEDLREQISSALKRVYLHREANEARRVAEEASQLKSRFLSVVSHELRTPLSMIVSLSDLLLEAEAPASPIPYQHELEVIRATGQHLDRLIRDVLDLGRSQLGQLQLTREALNLAELLEDVAPLGEHLAKDKGLSWQADIPESLPTVWGDRARLRQVLLNLISNACKFTNQGRVRLSVELRPKDVVISVQDTGLGVPIEEQQSIFDEFRQSQRTAMRGYGGMGLGLAISRRLIELHGGTIGVHSSGREGEGAVFFFSLPIAATVQAEDASPYVTDWEHTAFVISAADQESRDLRTYLERRGFSVELLALEQAETWLPLLQHANPAAIILNGQPPDGLAVRLTQVLQEISAARDIPVLIYRFSPDHTGGAVLDLSYLTKPLEPGPLVQVLEQQGLIGQSGSERARTILIVDDEPDILRLHASRLRGLLPEGTVLTANSGRQALDLVETRRPDLILLDLMMPEMDGFEVLNALRGRASTRDVPVIILTGRVLTEDVIAQLSHGVAGVLNKGMLTLEEMLSRIETVLTQSRRLGTEAQRIARQAMVFLHEHYAEPLTRQEIAAHVNVSERYVTRCFREELGLTPMEYLNRYRIQRARLLLRESSKSITEIALEVGFSSSAYFSRVFRKEMGISPREYKQNKHVTWD